MKKSDQFILTSAVLPQALALLCFTMSLSAQASPTDLTSCEELLAPPSHAPSVDHDPASPAIRVQKQRKHSPHAFDFAIGDEATVSVSSGPERTAYFIGRVNKPTGANEPLYYFVESPSQKVIFAKQSEIELNTVVPTTAAKPRPTSFLSGLIKRFKGGSEPTIAPKAEVAASSAHDPRIQNVITLHTQKGYDCAAHALFHCYLQLNDLQLMTDQSIKHQLDTHPDRVLKTLQKTYVNAENQPTMAKIAGRALKWLILDRRTRLISEPSQIEAQLDLVRKAGLKATYLDADDAHLAERLREHLIKGLPILLSLPMKAHSTSFYKAVDGGVGYQAQTGAVVSDPTKSMGGHAVLGVGYIPGSSVDSGSVLILDSDPGGFYVIDEREIVAGLRRFGWATLVGPND